MSPMVSEPLQVAIFPELYKAIMVGFWTQVFHSTEFQGNSQKKQRNLSAQPSGLRHVLCSGSKWNDISLGFPSHASLSLFFFSPPHKGVRAGLSCSGWRGDCRIVLKSMHEFLTLKPVVLIHV